MDRAEKTIAKREMTGKSRPLEPVMLALLIAAVLLLNLLWLKQGDWAFPNTDAYAYLANLLHFLDLAEAGQAPGFKESLKLVSHGGRSPAYQFLSVPSFLLFGRTEGAALGLNFVLVTVLIVAIYHMGRLAKDRKTGLLSAFLLICYPPVLHLTRVYVPHFAALVCVALSLWCLLVLISERRSIVVAWLLGLSLAFGLLFHPSFLWVAIGPTFVGGLYLLFLQEDPALPEGAKRVPGWLLGKFQDRFFLLGLLPAAIMAVALPSLWYLSFGSRLIQLAADLQTAGLEEFRGTSLVARGFPEVDPSFFWYLLTAPGALSVFFTGLILFGLVSVLFLRRMPLWILAVALVSGYLLISVQTSFWWMYGAPILPAAAVLAATFVMSVHPRWLRRGLVVMCLAVGGFTFFVATWGVEEGWTESVARTLGAPVDSSTCRFAGRFALCPGFDTGLSAEWPTREIFDTVLRDPACDGTQNCSLLYLFLRSDMAIGRFRYNLILDWPLANLHVTTLASSTWGNRFGLERLLSSDFIVYPANAVRRSGRANYRGATVSFLHDPPQEFAETHEIVGSFSYPGGTANLLKRTRPVSGREAEAVLSAIDLPGVNKAGGQLYVAKLYAGEGDFAKASTLYGTGKDKRGEIRGRKNLAESFEKAGNEEAAILELNRVLEMAPEEVSPRVRLARIYKGRGDVERAISFYEQALELSPRYLSARIELAWLYRQQEDFESAFSQLELAQGYAPENSWPVRTMARMYQIRGQNEQAIHFYKAALELDPGDEKSQKQLDRLLR